MPLVTSYTKDKIDSLLDALKTQIKSDILDETVVVVNAGTDRSTARPAGAARVYWNFSAGVDIGVDGALVTNAQVGDLFFVANPTTP